MATVVVNNRPFASEIVSGLMVPDGIFVTALGVQKINAYFTNIAATQLVNTQVYLESTDDPGIVVESFTHNLNQWQGGIANLLAWKADFSQASPGVHLVSFIVKNDSQSRRIIKKIFVAGLNFNQASKTFTVKVPECTMAVQFQDLIKPKNQCCGNKNRNPSSTESTKVPLDRVVQMFKDHELDFKLCLPGYLPHNVDIAVTQTPPYSGQYSDLPFADPWWKVLFALIAFFLAIAAAIAEAVDGTGEVTVTAGSSGDPGGSGSDCCGFGVEGGGTSYVAAGLLAAAATVATIAAMSDERDPWRRGQDHTLPLAGELTIDEKVKAIFSYPEPIALGQKFAVGIKWEYVRVTTGNTYKYGTSEVNQNIHALAQYTIDAPDVVRTYKRELFVVEAKFVSADGKMLRGEELFVQCFLVGHQGQWRSFVLQDNGANSLSKDKIASDGVYTGVWRFTQEDVGIWKFFVVAQDVNMAKPDMAPEEAAKIIGGLVLTQQLKISFDGGTCPLIPDGHVHVV